MAGTPVSPGGRPARLGRYLTLRTRAHAADGVPGDAYAVVSHDAMDVVIAPVLPGRVLPRVADRVDVVTAEGTWATHVRSVAPDRVVLAAPTWLIRARQRRAVRVTAAGSVVVLVPGPDGAPVGWAARLRDLSMTGASLAVETDAGLRVGDRHECLLLDAQAAAQPGGTTGTAGTAPGAPSAWAIIRSVRRHEHDLLAVAGIEWVALDPAARTWVTAHVSTRRGKPT